MSGRARSTASPVRTAPARPPSCGCSFGLIRSDGGTIHLFGRTWDSDGPYDQQAVRPRRRTTSSVTFPLLARQSAAELAVEVAPVIGTAPELTTLTLKRRG